MSASGIAAVVFDLGGVFLAWPEPAFFAAGARRLGVDPVVLEEALWRGEEIEAANVGGISAEEYARRCSVRLGVAEGPVYDLLESAFAGERADPEMVAYARALRGSVRVGALTNTWSFGRRLLARHGLEDLFDPIVSSAEEGVRKPDPRIFQRLLARVSLPPERVVFVDDVEENVAEARRQGFAAVRFLTAGQAIAEVDALLRRDGRRGRAAR